MSKCDQSDLQRCSEEAHIFKQVHFQFLISLFSLGLHGRRGEMMVEPITPKPHTSHFIKDGFFQIPFLKSHNSASFRARELGEVSFDSKFLTDYHTGCNSISAKWDLFSVTYTISSTFFFLAKNVFIISQYLWRITIQLRHRSAPSFSPRQISNNLLSLISPPQTKFLTSINHSRLMYVRA